MIVTLSEEQKEVVDSILKWNNQTQIGVIRLLLQALLRSTEDVDIRQDILGTLNWWNNRMGWAEWGKQQYLHPDHKVEESQLNEEENDVNN